VLLLWEINSDCCSNSPIHVLGLPDVARYTGMP
jgi:hypothetical protein